MRGGRPSRRLPAPISRGTRCSRRPTSRARTTSRCTACSARCRATTSRSAAPRATGAFRDQGITFSLSGEERPFPLDLVPRIIAADEWADVEAGVRQRVLRARGVPRRRLRRRARSSPTASCRAAWWSARRTSTAAVAGIDPPDGVRIHVAGHRPRPRSTPGSFRVLEDNLRTPSGISYVVENRRAMTHVFPELFASHRVRRGRRLPAAAARSAARHRAGGRRRPVRGRPHARRPQRRVLRALVPRPADGRRAGRGPRPRVPRPARLHAHDRGRAARRRRVPPHRRRLPRPAPVPARLGARLCRASSTRRAPATSRSRTRSATASPTTRPSTRTCPTMIRVLPRRGADPRQRRDLPARRSRRAAQWVLDRLDQLVCKPVDGSGGYGLVIGPQATEADARRAAREGARRPARLDRAGAGRAVDRADVRRRPDGRRATSTCGRSR